MTGSEAMSVGDDWREKIKGTRQSGPGIGAEFQFDGAVATACLLSISMPIHGVRPFNQEHEAIHQTVVAVSTVTARPSSMSSSSSSSTLSSSVAELVDCDSAH